MSLLRSCVRAGVRAATARPAGHQRSGAVPGTLRSAGAAATTLCLSLALACGESTAPDGNGGGNPAISVSVSASTLAIAAGESRTLTVTVTRTGGFTGAVALSASGLSAGVSTSFDPASLSAAATTSTLTVTAAANAGAATPSLTIRATGSGVTEATAAVAVTVSAAPAAGDYTLTVSPATVPVQQGQSASATVAIARTGGFAGAVALTASGLPAGVTAAFVPSSATGTEATLTLTAATGAAVGNATVTIQGVAQGLANRTASVTVQVTQATAGGNLVWNFCATAAPIWLAYQDGNGPWTELAVTPGSSVTIPIQAQGGVAFVHTTGVGHILTIAYAVRGELQAQSDWCDYYGAGRVVHGTVAGLAAADGSYIQLGLASAFIAPGTGSSFTINNAPEGPIDLMASRQTPTGANRYLFRRNIAPAAGATLPVLDFNGAEAFDPVTRNVTFTNLGADEGQVTLSYLTGNGTNGLLSTHPTGAGATHTYAGIPSAQQAAGDLHQLIAAAATTTATGVTGRFAYYFFRDATDKTVTLGPQIATPTVTAVATSPYVRARLQLPSQSEYDDQVTLGVTEFSAAPRIVTVGMSRLYLGSVPATWEITVPDLTGAGFNPIWAPQSGTQMLWSVFASGWPAAQGGTLTRPTEGLVLLQGLTGGVIQP
jgi:hypothetical protein